MLVKEPLEVECWSVYVMHANVETHGHMGSCPGYALLIMHGIATKPRKDEFRERIGRFTERTLAGGVKMETCQDRIAVRKRVREEKSSSEEVQGRCLRNPGIQMMSRWRFDMRTHLAVTSLRTNTKKRMRSIPVNKRGSGATSEEQLDEKRKTERVEHGAPNTFAFFGPMCCPGTSCEWWDTKSAGVRTCAEIRSCWWRHANFCVGCILRKGWTRESFTSEKCWSGIMEKMPEISKELDLVEKWTCLNVLEKDFFLWSEDPDEREKLENLEK